MRVQFHPARPDAAPGFTLIEVMVASGIFCIALVAILGAMSRGLGMARSLEFTGPDCGMLAAELSLTNQLADGESVHGDFGRIYPGFSWVRESNEVSSNGLYKVDFVILKRDGYRKEPYDQLSVLMYKPESQKSAFRPLGRR